MSFNPKVSIIIPVYNGSDYLREAIDSALAQTYKNIEILVINDGSNDGGRTEHIAKSFGDSIRYICKKNGGVASALNLGIREMTGEYFSWLSHDDLYYPHKVQFQVDLLMKLPQQNVFLYSDYQCIDEQSRHLFHVRADHELLSRKPLYAILRGNVHGCSVLVPKVFFDAVGLFNEELKTTQDYNLWFQMARKFKFIHIPEVLIKYRVHPAQGTNQIPEHLKECNQLWINFMTSLTEEEKLSCEKTVFMFYLRMAEHLNKSPYIEARNYASQKANNTFDNNPSNILAYILSMVDIEMTGRKFLNSLTKNWWRYKHRTVIKNTQS